MAHSGWDHELRAVELVGIMRLISLTFAPLTFSIRANSPAGFAIESIEILSAVDGPIALGDFGEPHQNGACDHEGQCVLTAVWNEAGEYMRAHLASYTLASIAEMARGGAPWPSTEPAAALSAN